MYNNFSIAISTTTNILRIKSELNFIEHVELTSTLSGIPFTRSFLNSYPNLPAKPSTAKLTGHLIYDELHFLWNYADSPIILYEINYHHDLGGKGDEAWIFFHHQLYKHYFEEMANIGVVLNKALTDSKLDLGKIQTEQLKKLHLSTDAPISFTTLGFKFKKHPEDFLL